MDLYGFLSETTVSDHAFLSIVGGGGKTTLLCNFAQYLKSQGKRVLLTTTTKIRSPFLHQYGQDRVFGDDRVLDYRPESGQVVLYAIGTQSDEKWTCPPIKNLQVLKEVYDVVLCEADGSRQRPVKVHTERDPVILPFTTHTISILGLWAIGKPLADVAFGDDRDLVVDESYLRWLVQNREGLLKGSLEGHRTILFNGADECETQAVFAVDYPSDVTVLTASLREGVLYGKIQ